MDQLDAPDVDLSSSLQKLLRQRLQVVSVLFSHSCLSIVGRSLMHPRAIEPSKL